MEIAFSECIESARVGHGGNQEKNITPSDTTPANSTARVSCVLTLDHHHGFAAVTINVADLDLAQLRDVRRRLDEVRPISIVKETSNVSESLRSLRISQRRFSSLN